MIIEQDAVHTFETFNGSNLKGTLGSHIAYQQKYRYKCFTDDSLMVENSIP